MNLRSLGPGLLIVFWLAADSHAATCESLQALSIKNTTITQAESVAAGALSLTGAGQQSAPQSAAFKQLPAFCRVAATLRPSTGSDIKIEVWMPLEGWNGKFQAVGNGGYAGSITYTSGQIGVERGMAEALKGRYATASTDTGHTGNTPAPFLGHPDKLVDFGYRAVHEMTVAAKAIVNAFYGRAPRFSYWNGCSTGGRQGLMQAQRFPDDYDGIIAGAPANPWSRLASWNVYIGQVNLQDPASTIPAAKYPMIHQAVLNACDTVDGLKDGLIDDPGRCAFDFKVLECKGADSPGCLTARQVESARKITGPAVRPSTGETILHGLALGTELGWAAKTGGPEPNALGTDFFKYVVFKDAGWNWRSFDFDSASALADEIGAATLNAGADLRVFKQQGRKLLLYHGWSDQNFSPALTLAYYNGVVQAVGSSKIGEWLRLFLAPGMGHCGGGEGPNAFDAVGALDQWVEKGTAPDQIVATRRTDGKVDRTRPLCPYPQVAKYKGSGSIDDATSFVCRKP